MALKKIAEDLLEAMRRMVQETAEAQPRTEEEAPDEQAEAAQTRTVRAVIRSARREMDPATLQGWSRVIFSCEDGVERKMYFPGDNGVYLAAGEEGLLEHREGAFVSFEKDSGEVVTPLFHLLPDVEE